MADSKSKHQIEISAVDKATNIIRSIESSFRGLGSLVGGSVVAGAFLKAAKDGMEFEKSIAKISTLLPGASNNMYQFAKGIERIKLKGLGESLGELSDGLYEVISAGVSADKSLKVLEVAAKASKAGFTDVRTAVDGLTTVMNSYQMSADNVVKISDIMFTAQNRGKTTFGEMAQSLANVLPIAASVGVKFEDVAGALSTLTMKGTPTAIAITGLRAIMAAFIEKGDASKFTTLGFAGALKDLEERTGGNQKKMQDYLGRVEALTTVLALTGENTKQLTADMIAMTTATGATELAVNKFMDTAEGRLKKFKSFISVSMAEFGQGFSDPISRALPGEDATLRQAEAFRVLGAALGYIATGLGYIAAIPMYVFDFIGSGIGHWAGGMRTGLAPVQILSNPGRLPGNIPGQDPIKNFMGPLPAHLFVGPLQDSVKKVNKSGDDISDALKKVAERIANWGASIEGSRFGEGRAIIGRLGDRTRDRGGIGIRAGRGGGRLSGGLFDTQFNSSSVPNVERQFGDADLRFSELQVKIMQIAPFFQQAMDAVMGTIVRGFITGKGQIIDVLNALRDAILNILAQIASRMAIQGLVSLIPGVGGFAAAGQLLRGYGNVPHGPIGAIPAPAQSSFGGMHVTLIVQGDLVNDDEKIRRFIDRGVTQAQRGGNKLSRYLSK